MKRILQFLRFLFNDRKIYLQTKEVEWAHIYGDSIRGKIYLQNLPINVGRWAGNYSFFYVLNRILNDYKPKNILDLGLGESSKFISAYLDNFLFESNHTIVEQDPIWISAFNDKFTLSSRSKIVFCELAEIFIHGHKVNVYKEFNDIINDDYDLYIVDGPFGSNRFSRYDIVKLVEKFTLDKEFIILMDDSERQGEQDTINDILKILKIKNLIFYIGVYSGNKQNTIIASEKYKFSISL
jgi:hypothetical protein